MQTIIIWKLYIYKKKKTRYLNYYTTLYLLNQQSYLCEQAVNFSQNSEQVGFFVKNSYTQLTEFIKRAGGKENCLTFLLCPANVGRSLSTILAIFCTDGLIYFVTWYACSSNSLFRNASSITKKNSWH
mgnify:CR=1 FL=1